MEQNFINKMNPQVAPQRGVRPRLIGTLPRRANREIAFTFFQFFKQRPGFSRNSHKFFFFALAGSWISDLHIYRFPKTKSHPHERNAVVRMKENIGLFNLCFPLFDLWWDWHTILAELATRGKHSRKFFLHSRRLLGCRPPHYWAIDFPRFGTVPESNCKLCRNYKPQPPRTKSHPHERNAFVLMK